MVDENGGRLRALRGAGSGRAGERLSVAFATVLRESGEIVGSTRFMNIDPTNRHVEIGSTWIVPAWQRTAVNTEAKYLMLRHAFESWKCLRVELKTDALNQQSRKAILRLGAKEEGRFRKHVITWSGRVRDSVYFSIIDTEWPEIKREARKTFGAVSPYSREHFETAMKVLR